MALSWTEVDLQVAQKNDVIIHQQNIKAEDLIEKELPSDIHMVYYNHDGREYSDAVRAIRKSDIFDIYYDKLKELDGSIVDIKSGFGNLRPNMYNDNQKKKG
jgi:cell wall assembly regulator SMI1